MQINLSWNCTWYSNTVLIVLISKHLFIESKYLPEKGRCLGVSPNHKILRLRCNRNHPSVRWLWTNSGHMMNLRTLRCLQAKTQRRSKTLILKQCDNNNLDQIWTCNRFSTIQNQGQKGFRKRWIRKHKKKSRSSLYFRNCNSDRSSYRGKYATRRQTTISQAKCFCKLTRAS